MKKDTHNHKVKSELRNKNGAWITPAKEFGRDIEISMNKVIKKYEGRLSTDAMLSVICLTAFTTLAYETAMSVKM